MTPVLQRPSEVGRKIENVGWIRGVIYSVVLRLRQSVHGAERGGKTVPEPAEVLPQRDHQPVVVRLSDRSDLIDLGWEGVTKTAPQAGQKRSSRTTDWRG